MRKLYLLIPILFLIYWGCEDSKEPKEDETPSVTLWGVVYSIEDTDSLFLVNPLPHSGLVERDSNSLRYF